MSSEKGFSVCYVVPGHNLLSSAGPSRNVLSLAGALAEWANVTIAFRRVLEPASTGRFTVLEIDPVSGRPPRRVDDAAVRGVGYGEFATYLRGLRRFATERLAAYDVVLEKSWLLSGYVSSLCRRRGIPAIPIENLVPEVDGARRDLMKAGRIRIGRWMAGRYLRSAPLIVAETEYLKAAITRRWRVAPERIEVIGVGVDRSIFRPLDQAEARGRLGIPAHATVLLYVGVLDRAHDLGPALDAVAAIASPSLRLHVVGDGALRTELEQRAGVATQGAVRFHGRVPHEDVPRYVAAADLCLAPYDPAVFPDGEVGYATLKVREYLASGRPVATVPSGTLRELIADGVTGFFFANDRASWREFLERGLPDRARLREMGVAAAATPLGSWEDAARAYRSVCERAMRQAREQEGAP